MFSSNFLIDHSFPKNFKDIVKAIFKRLFRVYAHIYYSHIHEVIELGIETDLDSYFKHFILFIREFNLVEERELVSLEDRINEILEEEGLTQITFTRNNRNGRDVALCLKHGLN